MPRHDLSAVAAKGDRLDTLVTLRDILAGAIDRCNDASELSSLALRLQRTLAEIDELGGNANEEPDDLAARRDAKLSAAASS